MSWRIVDLLSRFLEPTEREAVLGDLAESRETGIAALRDMLGLIVRRQAALWLDWRPWLILATLAVPLGTLFGSWAIVTTRGTAVPIWMYVDNWTSTYLTNPRARLDMIEIGTGILVQYLTLACWTWSAGFVLGWLTQRAIPVMGVLFCLLLVRPQYLWDRAPTVAPDSAVFALTFYNAILPVMVLILFAILPALWGMRHGRRLPFFSRRFRRILRIVSVAALVPIVLRAWVWQLPSLIVGLYGLHGERLRLFSLLAYWPIVYFVANGIARRNLQERNA